MITTVTKVVSIGFWMTMRKKQQAAVSRAGIQVHQDEQRVDRDDQKLVVRLDDEIAEAADADADGKAHVRCDGRGVPRLHRGHVLAQHPQLERGIDSQSPDRGSNRPFFPVSLRDRSRLPAAGFAGDQRNLLISCERDRTPNCRRIPAT